MNSYNPAEKSGHLRAWCWIFLTNLVLFRFPCVLAAFWLLTFTPNPAFSMPQDTPRYNVPAIAELRRLASEYSKARGLSPELVTAIIEVESSFNPHALSPKGAIGLMQVMPETGMMMAEQLGISLPYADIRRCLRLPAFNLEIGTAYLKDMLDQFNNVEFALAAYNAGPEAVIRYNGIPPYKETRDYVSRIRSRYSGPAIIMALSSVQERTRTGLIGKANRNFGKPVIREFYVSKREASIEDTIFVELIAAVEEGMAEEAFLIISFEKNIDMELGFQSFPQAEIQILRKQDETEWDFPELVSGNAAIVAHFNTPWSGSEVRRLIVAIKPSQRGDIQFSSGLLVASGDLQNSTTRLRETRSVKHKIVVKQ